MRSDAIAVSSGGAGLDAALAQAERAAEAMRLSHREALHLRLLVEETLGMLRSILGRLEGRLWIETGDGGYRLYLQTTTLLNMRQRDQLLSAASSGKNEAHRGLMGKLRAFFEPAPVDDLPVYLVQTVMPRNGNLDLTWSLAAYREYLRKVSGTSKDAREEWDELERSVVSHIADDITVSIRGYDVEIVISKKPA